MEFKTFFLYFITSYFICNIIFGLISFGISELRFYLFKKQMKKLGFSVVLNNELDDLKPNNKKTWN